MGVAFVVARGFGTGRYRVISPDGVECREGVDPQSALVGTLPLRTFVLVTKVRCPFVLYEVVEQRLARLFCTLLCFEFEGCLTFYELLK